MFDCRKTLHSIYTFHKLVIKFHNFLSPIYAVQFVHNPFSGIIMHNFYFLYKNLTEYHVITLCLITVRFRTIL